jgi:hypothetical protein
VFVFQVYVAVNITEEEFVRVAVGIENPDGAVVRKFGNSRTQEVEVKHLFVHKEGFYGLF